MGRSHLITGLILGGAIATTLSHAPLAVRLLVIPVAGGSALLPDIDKPGSRVARSLGPVTGLISRGVAAVAVAVYHATRTERDSPSDNGGHRRLSHTVPGCLLFGVFVAVAMLVHPAAGTAVLALLVGLTSQGFKALGGWFSLSGLVGSWLVVSRYPGWWWVFPIAVALGSWVHCWGDTVTSSGTPMWWPLLRDGKRWGKVTTPATFTTNDHIEHGPVTVVLWAVFVVSMGFASGVSQLVIRAVMA